MSTHRLSVSGERSETINRGGGFQAATYPAKAGDGVTVNLGSLHDLRVVLPQGRVDHNGRKVGAWVEHIKPQGSDSHYVILHVYGGVHDVGDEDGTVVKQATISMVLHGAPSDQGYPHTNVDVRKHDPEVDPLLSSYGQYDVVDAQPLAAPPTE